MIKLLLLGGSMLSDHCYIWLLFTSHRLKYIHVCTFQNFFQMNAENKEVNTFAMQTLLGQGSALNGV